MSGSCTTLFRYPWVRIPKSTSGVDWDEDSFRTAKFGRDSWASFADYREGRHHSFLCLYQVTTIPCSYQVKTIPCLYQVTMIPCLYQVTIIPCLYQVTMIPCLYQEKRAIHISVLGVVGASKAGIMLKSNSWAVCARGTWLIEIHAFEVILGSE